MKLIACFNKILVYLLKACIRGYQWFISPLLGSCCRFHPRCSEYAHQAVCLHGPARGGLLAVRRILRCHPWHEGGLDPVPPIKQSSHCDQSNHQAY